MYEFISPMLDIFRILFLGSNAEITDTITLCLPTVVAQAVFLLALNWTRLLYFVFLQVPYSTGAIQTW